MKFSSSSNRMITIKSWLYSSDKLIVLEVVQFSRKLSLINIIRLNCNPKFLFPCQKMTSLGLKRKIVENSPKVFTNQKNNITIVIFAQNRVYRFFYLLTYLSTLLKLNHFVESRVVRVTTLHCRFFICGSEN